MIDRLSITELRALENRVEQQPADHQGVVRFLKSDMLTILRSAIAAEEELERQQTDRTGAAITRTPPALPA